MPTVTPVVPRPSELLAALPSELRQARAAATPGAMPVAVR